MRENSHRIFLHPFRWNFKVKSISKNSAPATTWVKKMVYLQIAVQAGISMTPFYALTVQAAVSPFSVDRQSDAAAQQLSTFG